MANLKDLKSRIDSVRSTRKITQAMQMVAAAKLRRAEEAAAEARPYAERMQAVMGALARSVEGSPTAPKLLAGTGSEETHLLVVMTSERGLAGGFNAQIVRKARARLEPLVAEGKTVKILTVGRKGRDMLRRDHGDRFVGHHDMSEVRRFSYADAQRVAGDVLTRFGEGEFDVATIYFNSFQTVLSQVPTETRIVPVTFEDEAAEADQTLYEYEPSEEEVLVDLLPRGVTTQIFAALLENTASEHGARMSAMDSATRNAGEMIDNLTIQYNRTRQAVITNELIEIISGAEAL